MSLQPQQPPNPFLRQRAVGFSVIPVHGKTPLVPWKKYQEARPALHEIAGWLAQWPDAGLAIVCGQVSRLAVLDVDPRHGGHESVKDYPPLTRTVWTGGGGWHTYLRVNESIPTIHNLLPGVDLQGEGAYVVAPPSIHPNGQPYKWVGPMTREIPEWLRQLIAKESLPLPHPAVASSSCIQEEAAQFLETWLDTAKPGDRILTRCPVHEDETPSLRVIVLEDGRPWVKCFGCGAHHSAILAALVKPLPE